MAWLNANASWPASAQAIKNNADTVLSQVGGVMSSALSRLATVDGKVVYNRHDLSTDAQTLINLRANLNNLLVQAKILTVTPMVYGIGQDGYLSSKQAINALAAKLEDTADRNKPTNQNYALVLLLSATSPVQILSQLTPICALLAVPSLLEYQRQLQKLATLDSEKMQQNTPALTPRWKAAGALNLQPLRAAAGLLGAQIAQLETLSSDATTPLNKLTALANKRTAMLEQLQTDLTALATVTGNIWRYEYNGSAAALATQLRNSAAPVNKPVSAAVVISSQQPLTFFRELLA